MYAQYMDGQVWKLIQCEDFDCSVETLRARIGTYARGRGMRVRTRTIKEDPPALAVQAYKPEEER